MDLGPITRELAPLKYKKPEIQPVKSKILLKVGTDEDNLFNNHVFHHLLGLSHFSQGIFTF